MSVSNCGIKNNFFSHNKYMNDLKDKLYKSDIKNIEKNLTLYIKSIKDDSLKKKNSLNKKDIKTQNSRFDF